MKLSRRNLLSFLGTAPLLSLPTLTAGVERRRMLRIAYLTDIHLPPYQFINDRAKKAFSLANRCDLVLFGGDNVMSIDHQKEKDIQEQYDNWQKFTGKYLTKPFLSILGNHDIEQWGEGDSSPMSGKARPAKFFGMKHRFWEEKMAGWRLIGLDTVHRDDKDGFIGFVDAEQVAWLKEVLSDKRTPTLVCGHIPLLSITALAHSDLVPTEKTLPISFTSEVSNAREVVNLFRKAGNVKLCLSGHSHMIDRCDYSGTSYINAGAVCGNWWNGAYQDFAPSYAQIDLMSDGSFEHRTIFWEA